jgi:hypothetical protein
MCAVFQFQNRIFKPGRKITACAKDAVLSHVWAGFARHEILDWWMKKGGMLLDIHAGSFAERSDDTRRLVWDSVPKDHVIRGILDVQSSHALIKVVTRAATIEERAHFQHPRMPLLESPLFGSNPPAVTDQQPSEELFGFS